MRIRSVSSARWNHGVLEVFFAMARRCEKVKWHPAQSGRSAGERLILDEPGANDSPIPGQQNGWNGPGAVKPSAPRGGRERRALQSKSGRFRPCREKPARRLGGLIRCVCLARVDLLATGAGGVEQGPARGSEREPDCSADGGGRAQLHVRHDRGRRRRRSPGALFEVGEHGGHGRGEGQVPAFVLDGQEAAARVA